MSTLIVIVVSYLLGSIPFGYLIVRAKTGSDVRKTGSGGTGATNVSRGAGKVAGVLTLLLDALKGAGAVLLARTVLTNSDNLVWWIGAAGLIAIIGHIFPVWLHFRGGKGVATAVGVFAVLTPLPLLGAGALFVLVVWLTRYVSLGSILAAVSVPVLVLINGLIRPEKSAEPLFIGSLVAALLIIYAHRQNILRLIHKTESKFR